jgi:hypothetical protein
MVARSTAVGVLLATVLMGLAWALTPDPPPGANGERSFAEVFDRPTTRAEVMMNRRDGPAFAQIATDLSLDHPEGFHDFFAKSTPEEELAYRAGRPMLAWLAWLFSFGAHRSLLAPALMLLTLIGLGGVVAATAHASVRRGMDPSWSWLAVLLPGLAVSVWAPGGCEPIALAATLLGWTLWSCDRQTRLPVLLWCFAALTRETSLLVPIGIGIAALRSLERRTFALAIPPLVYALWLAVVRWRTGLLPGNAGGERVSSLFRGFVDGTGGWTFGEWSFLVLVILTGVLAWNLLPMPHTRPVLLLHVVLASTLGRLVWEQAIDFTRIFVLVEVLGLLAVLPVIRERTGRPARLEGAPQPA